ncbi:MAG: hypothetical protein RL211_1257 [Pseudomonadota bacterium]
MRALKYVSWGDTTGYAVAAKSYVKALIEAGIDLSWTPMLTGKNLYEVHEGMNWPCPILQPVCNRVTDYDTVLIHTVPEYYPPWIEKERRAGRRILGYAVWELDRLPDHWPTILNRLDGVIVPCRWNVEVFRNSGVTVPIHVVPHLSQFDNQLAADTRTLHANPGVRLGRVKQEAEFVFYTVGFWSHRKALYLALEAYWRAFQAGESVLMVIKTSAQDITCWHRHWRNAFRMRHPSPQRTIASMAKRFPHAAPVLVIADESLSEPQMRALHEAGDCFVSLSRAEGWGLGAFEAARLGRPVVMTGYGGQLDFLDPKLAYLVDYDMVAVHEPTWAANYRPTDQWAGPRVDHAVAHLRTVFENRSEAKERARQLAEKIRQEFSRDAVLASLMRALA